MRYFAVAAAFMAAAVTVASALPPRPAAVGPIAPDIHPHTALAESIRRMRLSLDRELLYMARAEELVRNAAASDKDSPATGAPSAHGAAAPADAPLVVRQDAAEFDDGFTSRVNDGTGDYFRPIRPGSIVPNARQFADSSPQPDVSDGPVDPTPPPTDPSVPPTDPTVPPTDPTVPPTDLPVPTDAPTPSEVPTTDVPTPTETPPVIPNPTEPVSPVDPTPQASETPPSETPVASDDAIPSTTPEGTFPTQTPEPSFEPSVPPTITPSVSLPPVFPSPSVEPTAEETPEVSSTPGASPDSTSAAPSSAPESSDPENPGAVGETDPPSPTPTASAASSDDSVCFPRSATVLLEDGSLRTMDQLRVGDRVQVAPGVFSPIFMFSHKLAAAPYSFVKLVTESQHAVSLTAGHYLYVNGRLAAAKTVHVGDSLTLGNGLHSTVVRVEAVDNVGLFNPQTLHGDVIVDGIRASTFTTAVHPPLATALMAPLRAAFSRFGFALSCFDNGASRIAATLPDGAVVN